MLTTKTLKKINYKRRLNVESISLKYTVLSLEKE